MQEITFGDVTRVVIARLNIRLVAVPDTARAHRVVPNPRPSRFVIVQRMGGPRTQLHVSERAQITVEAWDNDPEAALQLAQFARAVIYALSGERVDGIQFYGMDEFSGPADLPDDDFSQQSRFTWTMSLHCRAINVA